MEKYLSPKYSIHIDLEERGSPLIFAFTLTLKKESPLSFFNATQHRQKFYTQIQHFHSMDKFLSPNYNIHIDLEERGPPLIFESSAAWTAFQPPN